MIGVITYEISYSDLIFPCDEINNQVPSMFMVQNQTDLDQDIFYPCSYGITGEYPVKVRLY